jgi:pimeloyl-ACP methyl ester carboxylesterase
MDEPSAEALHSYAMDLFMAAGNYSSAYAAAMRYRALEALPRLTTPATFMARADDVLYPFLDVLEANCPTCARVERLPADEAAWRTRLRALFRLAGGTLRGPDAPAALRRGYASFDHGQLHLRCSGTGPRAVLVLHDPPGSGLDVEAVAAAIGGRRVIVPDLPGCGMSDPLGASAGCGDYARVLVQTMDRMGADRFAVIALGLAVPLAVSLAAACPARVEGLLLDGMPVVDGERAREFAARYAPAIEPRRDGSHFHATWHRLRDEQLQWPWYDGSRLARRRIAPELDAMRLHRRLVATLQQPEAYGRACRAALGMDLATATAALTVPVCVLDASPDPRYAGVVALAAAARQGRRLPRPAGGAATPGLLREFLGT